MFHAIQVKTASRDDHQFNVGKFLNTIYEDVERQRVIGRKVKLDPRVLNVFVFLGDKVGDNEFAGTNIESFADFLAEAHTNFLQKNGGPRPAKS